MTIIIKKNPRNWAHALPVRHKRGKKIYMLSVWSLYNGCIKCLGLADIPTRLPSTNTYLIVSSSDPSEQNLGREDRVWGEKNCKHLHTLSVI